MAKKIRSLSREVSGQSMVEFIIVFPVMMLLTMGIMQMALIYTAKQVVHYAAFRAARVQLVAEENEEESVERAAEIVCAPITGTTLPGGHAIFDRSDASKIKTSARKIPSGSREVTVEVTHHFELIMPLINRVFVFPWEGFLGMGGVGPPEEYTLEVMSEARGWLEEDISSLLGNREHPADWGADVSNVFLTKLYGTPHILIKAQSTLPKPWGVDP